MGNVSRGHSAIESRRNSAKIRLEKHLKDHKCNHTDDFIKGRFTDETWIIHDKNQRNELNLIIMK